MKKEYVDMRIVFEVEFSCETNQGHCDVQLDELAYDEYYNTHFEGCCEWCNEPEVRYLYKRSRLSGEIVD